MSDFAYALQGDRLPALPDDVAMPNLPPPPMSPQQQFGMNGGGRPVYGIPKFFIKAIKNRNGQYVNVEFAEIITPGDPKATPVRKVTDGLRMKYREHYEHWKRTQTMAPVGTPLEMWPEMTPAMVHQLKASNIFTVEQLAGIADANLGNIPFGKTIRNKAQAWLQVKEKSDAVSAAAMQTQAMQDAMRMMEEKNAQEKAEMKAENADLKAKLDAILARLGSPETPAPVEAAPETPKRGPGRPRASEAA